MSSVGLGLLQRFSLPHTTRGITALFLGSSLVAAASQLWVIFKQWRHMSASSYRPPASAALEDLPATLAVIKRHLAGKACSVIGTTVFNTAMLFGGGLHTLWGISSVAAGVFAPSRSTTTRTVITSALFTSISLLSTSLVALIASQIPYINAYTIPTPMSLKQYMLATEPGQEPQWARWRVFVIALGSTGLLTVVGSASLEWAWQAYGKYWWWPTLAVSVGVGSLFPVALGGVLGVMVSRYNKVTQTTPPAFPADNHVSLAEWKPPPQDLEGHSLDTKNFEDRIRTVGKDAGREDDYQVWVELDIEDRGTEEDRLSKKALGMFYGPSVEEGNRLLLKASQLVHLTEEENLALIATALSKHISSFPPRLLVSTNIGLITLGLAYASLVSVVLPRADLILYFFPSLSLAASPPLAVALSLCGTLLEPLSVALYALQSRVGRKAYTYRIDDLMCGMGDSVRSGWIGLNKKRDAEQVRRGRKVVVDVGSCVGWYSEVFLKEASVTERLSRMN